MSMAYCKRCDVRFDTDTTEQADYCRHCEALMPMAQPARGEIKRQVPWPIRPAVGDRALWEMDTTLRLAWDDQLGWCFDGVTVDDIDGRPITIERDGTILIDDGWRQHSPLAKAIANAAEHCFEIDRRQVTADLPTYWPAEDHDYTDRRFRGLRVA